MKVVVIVAGCAECHSVWDGPLIESREFESVGAAKAHYEAQSWWRGGVWTEHPQGGEYADDGQGGVWITGRKP